MSADPWREIASLEELEADMFSHYVAQMEERAEETGDPDLRMLIAPCNRTRLAGLLRPMIEKDAAAIWARHLANEGRLS